MAIISNNSTIGEILVGPAKALFIDEISTGLESSATYQVVNSLKQYVHISDETAVISLLQPAPETYELFDDIILLSDGQIVYQGPRENVLEFFESTGFKCPESKSVADFLQEVTSRKDQAQYRTSKDEPYRFVTVNEFAEAFKSFHMGQNLRDHLSTPLDRSKNHPAALTTQNYGFKQELLKACLSREYLLMNRDSFPYIFQLAKFTFNAAIVATLFMRTKMHHNKVDDGLSYLGPLFFSVVISLLSGLSELSMTIAKLPVFYKQRDLRFYHAWAYAFSTWILKIPMTFLEVAVWVSITYYSIGFDPNVGRLYRQFLLLILVNQMDSALFRTIAANCRNMIVAYPLGLFVSLLLLALGGSLLSRGTVDGTQNIKSWWIWGYWMSPLMYGQTAILVNEFLGKKWSHVLPKSSEPLGIAILRSRGFFTNAYWCWVGLGTLIGWIVLFNILYALSLTYRNPTEKARAVKSRDPHNDMQDSRAGEAIEMQQRENRTSHHHAQNMGENQNKKRGMGLSFEPHYISFDDVTYSVDMPQNSEIKYTL
ncbi:ABC-2 type transporter [Parasponia andersonii]|uniref:ABC-2 type transporter n=1 Tax=Parasponia andersonii TaxID=3476 RepID=A0A2P5CZB8_PARAD|nr:ABC-2 type transporter [Parasponia andersonii]